MTKALARSSIYTGRIFHRRFMPRDHRFDYSLYMLLIDVSDIEKPVESLGLFGLRFYHPLRFVQKDYLPGDPLPLRERINLKVQQLGGHSDIASIKMLVQVRCFGIYFSPVNFYFCYDQNHQCTQMLAEVSNTPWNERHYYWVDLLKPDSSNFTEKVFQVSPFMDLNMLYQWRITPPSDNAALLVGIDNIKKSAESLPAEKIFSARLSMKKLPFTTKNLLKIWCQLPVMTLKVVASIYWQAAKLFCKRIPFIGYQKAER